MYFCSSFLACPSFAAAFLLCSAPLYKLYIWDPNPLFMHYELEIVLVKTLDRERKRLYCMMLGAFILLIWL